MAIWRAEQQVFHSPVKRRYKSDPNMSYGEDIGYYLRVAIRRFPFFIIPLVLVAVTGTAIVLYLPAIYTSKAMILVESQQIPEDFVKSTVTALATERIQVIQQRVKSRETLLRIVAKFDLFADRKGLSRTEVEELMRDRVALQILDLNPAGRRPRASDGLTVAFSVSFDYERPDVAAKVANELVTIILDEDIQNRTGRAVETTSFLTRETERLSGELTSIDAKIADFKLKYSEMLPEKLSYNLNLLDKTQRQILEIDRELRNDSENRRLLQFEASVRMTQVNATAPGAPTTLEGQLQALKAEYEQRSMLYSENHPEMRTLKKLIAVKQQAADHAKAEAAKAGPVPADDPSMSFEARLIAQKIEAIDSNGELLRKQREDLTAASEKLQKIVTQTPQIGADLSGFLRRREALQNSGDEMSDKLSRARLGERMEENQKAERFEVIEAPVVPQEPSRPQRLPLLLMVAGLSIAMGGGSAFGAEFLDSTIQRSSDLTRKMNQRLLVVVPYITTRNQMRKRGLKAFLWVGVLVLAVLVALAAIHMFYAPLDVLTIRAMSKLDSIFN